MLGHERRIAEADVQGGGALHSVERPLHRLDAVAARLLGAGLHPRLVELHDVGAGGEEVEDLLADRVGVGERDLLLVLVEVVLRLLGHRERPRHGHLHEAVGVGAQEAQVVDLHRLAPADRRDDARHRRRVALAVQGAARIVEIDALQRGGKPVGVALAAHLAVGEDVQPGAFLVADRHQDRVVLRLAQVGGVHPPQLAGPHARREPVMQRLAIDEPVGLRV